MLKKLLFIRRLFAGVVMAGAAAWLAAVFGRFVLYVFSGDFLASRFRLPSELAGDSYSVNINRMLICAVITFGVGFTACLIVRWLLGWRGRLGRWAVGVTASFFYVFPLSCVMIALHMLFQYMWAMGFTWRRIVGFSLAFWMLPVLIGTWLWVTGVLKRKQNV